MDVVENLVKTRFKNESNENYPKDALYMYAENQLAIKSNEAFLNALPGELYTTEADDKIPNNCKYLVTTQAAQSRKQTNTGGLVYLLKLKIDAKVILTVNLDIQDRLLNRQIGYVKVKYMSSFLLNKLAQEQ